MTDSLSIFINDSVDVFQKAVLSFIQTTTVDIETIVKSKFKEEFISLIEALNVYEKQRKEMNTVIVLNQFKDIVKAIRID